MSGKDDRAPQGAGTRATIAGSAGEEPTVSPVAGTIASGPIPLGQPVSPIAGTIASGPIDLAPATIASQSAPGSVHDAGAALDESGPRYQRGSLLGEGGMGQVWLSRDARIGRRVAMKIIRSASVDASAQARFLREARVQGQLEHPSVVPVYDIGHAPDGEIFFTMKRVRGDTLADVITKLHDGDAATGERYSQRRLLTAFSQVCLAIEFAHAHGVIHRDLKPENLMLGDHGEVYVLDWGVARVLRDDIDHDEPITTGDLVAKMAALGNQTGVVGTPGYIAPEQLKGRPIGPTADVFALGAILFEIIGHRPLIRGNPLGRLEATFSGLDTAALVAELGNAVQPELAALCVRATAPEPEDRVRSARALHDGIEAYLDGERDQELRRELAEKHLAVAREAMRVGNADLEAHKRALREVGRALAVVPDHREARELSLQLFAAPPTSSPPEVEAAIDRDRDHQSRITAKGSAQGMASMALFLPVLMVLGIRSWRGIGLFIGMALAAAAVSAMAARGGRKPGALLYLVVFSNNLVFGMCAGLYGALVLVPAMVVTNTISFALLHLDPWPRRFAVLTGCLAIAVPIVLPLFGILPSAYVPMGDGILMRPLWLAFPPTGTLLFLMVGTLIAVVNGTRAVAQVRDALNEAERRVQMQRWQLSQLLPDERAEDRS